MKTATDPAILPITEDLYLRPATPGDAQALYYLIDTQRPYLREWLPFVDFSQRVQDTEQYLQQVTAKGNMADKVYVIMYHGELAGLIGLKGIDYLNKKLEIGYYLSENLQGNGIMRRSCEELLKHAFETLRMNRIQVKVGVGNHRSSNIPKKLGFTLEGVQREGEYLNGTFHDLEVYSLLRRDWLERP